MTDFLPGLLTSNSSSVIGGVLLVVYAAITSLRKRRDVSIAELEKRVADLERRLAEAESEHAREVATERAGRDAADQRAEGYQALMLAARRDAFTLRTALADNGIPDPTIP